MVHQYKNNGRNIVLDVNSGSVHVVDDLAYDAIALYDKKSEEEIVQELKGSYPENDIREVLEDIRALKDAGQLFTEDIYRGLHHGFQEAQDRCQGALSAHCP